MRGRRVKRFKRFTREAARCSARAWALQLTQPAKIVRSELPSAADSAAAAACGSAKRCAPALPPLDDEASSSVPSEDVEGGCGGAMAMRGSGEVVTSGFEGRWGEGG